MDPLMDAVSHYGFEILRATNVTESRLALEARCDNPALVIADYKLRDETAAEVLECVGNLCGEVPFLVLSGEIRSGNSISICERELPLIHKPATPGEIVAAIARLTTQPPTSAN